MTGTRTEPLVAERRLAVAVHEAGHGVVFAFLRYDVQHIQMGLDADPGGVTYGTDLPITDPIDYMAALHAGNVAVDELCGGYRLPVVDSPASDEAKIAAFEAEFHPTDYQNARAPVRARQLIQLFRDEVMAIAAALLASPTGRLEGKALEDLLGPVWAKPAI